ncbi:MAG: FAD-dependent oxidoreductase [Streptomycetaceae bacterium]|nr:FAD-dependent oxidoreductase [Streptomycetaceae bacterium]
MTNTRQTSPRTAVIGAGVAGLTAAYVLRRTHEVTLFEADARLGGHAHTHDVADPAGPLRVDSGFIVHNARTYPTLLRLFRDLGVETREAEMSMSVCCDECGLQSAGGQGPRGLFPVPGNAANGRYLRMLAEVPRFHRAARRFLARDGDDVATVGAFLRDLRFDRYFVQHFAVPLIATVWSCAPGVALRYPAAYLFRFLDHHGMLSVGGSPTWRTVCGGSRDYVERIRKALPRCRVAAPVLAVRRHADGVDVTTADGETESFDAVVIATHANQALAMLDDPGPDERRVLGAIGYSANCVVLHDDTSVLPAAHRARASWNHRMPSCAATADHVVVSYDLTRLQRLPTDRRYLVTLGNEARIDPASVIARTVYEHPTYTPESVAARRLLPQLSGPVTAFAGAYHGWGFHEDGCRSGLLAAEALGGRW